MLFAQAAERSRSCTAVGGSSSASKRPPESAVVIERASGPVRLCY